LAILRARTSDHPSSVDDQAPAEVLPYRYRTILDGIAALEGLGRRRDALRIRAAATRAYSRAWDARALRTLDGLIREIERLAERSDSGAPPRAGLMFNGRPTTAP